jgi:tetratricopeptide (TPR) repeat protein
MVWVLTSLIAVGGVVAWRWPRSQPPVRSTAREEDGFVEAAARNPGYLGPQACAPCHPARVATVQETRHFRACIQPRPGAMPPGFAPDKGRFTTRDPVLRFEMTREGDDFFQTTLHMTPTGTRRTSSRIAFVYGSKGVADEVYFTWHDDRLYELPMVWLNPSQQWGVEPFNPHRSGDFSRTTTTRCLECHNTWFAHVASTENQYRRDSFLLGVTCENCHGPGQEHVAFHQAHPDAKSGAAIVHPGRLSRERLMDVCGQCHSNVPKSRNPACTYRPGESVETHFRRALLDLPENDHVADQVKYLRRSKCFQKSDTLTCVTCHDPHCPTDHAKVRRACQKCHQPAHCTEQERLPVGVRDNCVGCHMPQYPRTPVLFHTEDDQYVFPMRPHDHRVAVHPAARQEVLRAWYRTQPGDAAARETARLTGELVEHWLVEAEKYRREYRFVAAIGAVREALRFDDTPTIRARLREVVAIQAKLDADMFTAQQQLSENRYNEAIETLNQVLQVKPNQAQAHGKLGTLYAATGRRELAVEHLQTVARCDPDEAYGHNMLGWIAYLEGKAEEAVEAFRRADEIEPYSAEIHYRWGLALLKLSRWPEAATHFRKVLAIDPNHAGGCQGLSHALRSQGEPAEAVDFARRAARLTRFQNPDVLLTLADACVDAGRSAEAEDALARALDAAQKTDPTLALQIRRRLEELRARSHRP